MGASDDKIAHRMRTVALSFECVATSSGCAAVPGNKLVPRARPQVLCLLNKDTESAAPARSCFSWRRPMLQKRTIPCEWRPFETGCQPNIELRRPELEEDFGSETRKLICVRDRAFQCGEGR